MDRIRDKSKLVFVPTFVHTFDPKPYIKHVCQPLGLWVVVLLPLVISGLMAGMKVGELAAMLVSGSGSVGSGMMALVVRGGGRLSAAANPARPPIPGG